MADVARGDSVTALKGARADEQVIEGMMTPFKEHAQDGLGVKRPAGRASELRSDLVAGFLALCASTQIRR